MKAYEQIMSDMFKIRECMDSNSLLAQFLTGAITSPEHLSYIRGRGLTGNAMQQLLSAWPSSPPNLQQIRQLAGGWPDLEGLGPKTFSFDMEVSEVLRLLR